MDFAIKEISEAKSIVEDIYKKIKDVNYDKHDLATEIAICISNNPTITVVHIGENKETLLMLLVKENIPVITKTAVRKILKEYGNVLLSTDKLGNTALMHAAMVNNIDFLEQVSNSALSIPLNLKKSDNKNDSMLARQYHFKEVLEEIFEGFSYLIVTLKNAIQYLVNDHLPFFTQAKPDPIEEGLKKLNEIYLEKNSIVQASGLSQEVLLTHSGAVSHPSIPTSVLSRSNSMNSTGSHALPQELVTFSTDEPSLSSTAPQEMPLTGAEEYFQFPKQSLA
jgi:hypothetical protein